MTDDPANAYRVDGFRRVLLRYHEAIGARRDDPTSVAMDRVQGAGLALVAMYQHALRGTPLTQVLREVEAERFAQVAAGYDAAHDDGHVMGEIAFAAGMFALPGRWRVMVEPEDSEILTKASEIRQSVSWVADAERRKALIVAAALAIAEVERMDRATPS